MREDTKKFMILAAALVVAALLTLLCGCRSTRYVPVQSVIERTDTLEIERVRVDSVVNIIREYVRDERFDSVAPVLDSLNRVIGFDRWHFRTIEKSSSAERLRLMATIDSLKAVKQSAAYIEKPVPYPEVREVERKRRWWESALMWCGGIAIAVGVFFCYKRLNYFAK